MTTWERIDEPVLRWVASLPPTQELNKIWDFRGDEDDPVEHVEPLNVDAALHRLYGHGFISGQNEGGMHLWWQLRLAPNGLIYLGEWPDVELATSSEALRAILRALADDAPDDKKDALARTAGFIGRTMDGVLRDTVNTVAGDIGKDLG